MKCAHCKRCDETVTIAHVKACSGQPAPVVPAPRTDLQQHLREAQERRIVEVGLGDLLARVKGHSAPQAPAQRPVLTASPQDAHKAMAARIRGGVTPLTDSVREACAKAGVKPGPKRRGGAPKGPSQTMALLAAWTPGQEVATDAPF